MRETDTVHGVADYLGVCAETIYKMVREKQIPHGRVRKKIIFRKAKIDEWIDQQHDQSMTEYEAM
jgi:excisionase family DNA binding protein